MAEQKFPWMPWTSKSPKLCWKAMCMCVCWRMSQSLGQENPKGNQLWLFIGGTGVEGFPCGSDGKESSCNVEDLGSILGVRKIPWRRKWQPTPLFLPGEFHGQRSLASYSPWGCKESDTTEQLNALTSFTSLRWTSADPISWDQRRGYEDRKRKCASVGEVEESRDLPTCWATCLKAKETKHETEAITWQIQQRL